MAYSRGFNRLSRLLIGLLLGLILMGLSPIVAFSQASGNLGDLCRRVNPAATTGLIAYYAPGGTLITTSNGETDGPAAGDAVYLTNARPETSADGSYIRIWFDSLEPNFKQGWISQQFNNGRNASLMMGDNRWRMENCAE